MTSHRDRNRVGHILNAAVIRYLLPVLTCGHLLAQASVGVKAEDFIADICSNGAGEFHLYDYNSEVDSSQGAVVWLIFFTSWCVPCQAEAPYTESIYQAFKDQGLIAVGIGFDWNYPYSCEEWSQTFGLTYLVIDDSSKAVTNQFGVANVPHHIILDHRMTVRYSSARWIMTAIVDTIQQLISELPTIGIDQNTKSLQSLLVSATMHPAYPNPFNPMTTLRFDLPQQADVMLTIHDILGREVRTLVTGMQEPGYHQTMWDSRNSQGRELPSGIYIARMTTPTTTKSIKLVLLR